jgi:hypothetical protein
MCHAEITGVSAIYCKRSVPLGTHWRTGWYTHSNTGSYGPNASRLPADGRPAEGRTRQGPGRFRGRGPRCSVRLAGRL